MLMLFYGMVIDVYLDVFFCEFNYSSLGKFEILYLQMLFEFVLKCLLLVYKICIYQLGKVYWYEGQGCWYNFEFIMLEWYWVGFDYYVFMQEVSDLLKVVFDVLDIEMVSYQQVFF